MKWGISTEKLPYSMFQSNSSVSLFEHIYYKEEHVNGADVLNVARQGLFNYFPLAGVDLPLM